MKALQIILILFPMFAFGQINDFKFNSEFEKTAFQNLDNEQSTKNKLALFYALNTNTTDSSFNATYNYLLNFSLTYNLSKGPRKLFDETQNHFFKNYEIATGLDNLTSNGTFNCVTGTAIMAFFLEHNGFEYEIEEMPYHVFLSVTNKNKKYILETTDTQYGFLRDIKPNRRQYFLDTIDNNRIFKEIGEYSHLDNGQLVVKGTVTLTELAGLNYYNAAIKHINNNNYQEAAYQMQKANFLYPSKRVEEIYKYCLLKVLKDKSLSKKDKLFFHECLSALTFSFSSN